MSSLLLNILSVSLAASIMFLELLITERFLRGRYNRLLLIVMKIVTVFYLFPAIMLVGVILGSIIEREVVQVNMDDVKWIIRGVYFSDLPGMSLNLFKVRSIWLIGTGILLFIKFARGKYLLTKIFSTCVPADENVVVCKNRLLLQHGIKERVKLLKGKEIKSPFLTGVIHPQIVLPDMAFSEAELEMMLTHELIHLKNKDILFKSMAAIVQCLNWFNPIIYIYINKVYEFCEYVCDEEVVRFRSKEERVQYARLIVSLADGRRIYEPSMMLINNGKMVMERRVYQIMKPWKKKKSKVIMAITASILALCPVTVYASVSGVMSAQNKLIKVYEDTRFIDTDWENRQGVEVHLNLTEADKVLSVTRETNVIDETIAAGRMIKISLGDLDKGQLVKVYLTGDNSSDQYTVSISDSSGNGKKYSSENGDVYFTHTVSYSDEYSVLIRETNGQNSIHLTGTIKNE